jgi:hypothetical protein
MGRPFALGVGVGLALVAAALLVVLSRSDQRVAATNSSVVASGRALKVSPLHVRCSHVRYIPDGAAGVRVYAGTLGRRGSPLRITVSRAGRPVTGTTIPGGYRTEPLSGRMPAVPRDLDGATVCLRNLGPNLVQFAGNTTSYNKAAGQTAGREDIRFDFLRSGRESWWQMSGTVAARFSRVKPAWMGAWTMWAALAALGLLWAGALAVLRRSLR